LSVLMLIPAGLALPLDSSCRLATSMVALADPE
jgi:hypothetical protein